MCVAKDKLLELMEDFPEARKYYFERAWERRIEFRRQLKLFRLKVEDIDMFTIRHEMSEQKLGEESDSSALSDNSDFLQSEGENIGTKTQEKINESIKGKISKFYFYNDFSREQLKEEDISQEELERLSDDEIPDNLGSMLHDDNKLASFKLAKRINMQMGKMIEAFSCISKNMDVNLKNLQTYITDLQR
jgi:hypothetical protein